MEDVNKAIQMIIDEETEKNIEKMKNEFVDRLIALGKNTVEEISCLVGMPIDQVRQKMKRHYA